MSKREKLERNLLQEIQKIPVIDIHTHIRPERPVARNLYQILADHHLVSELEKAGLKSEEWKTPNIPEKDKVSKMIPYFQECKNTANFQSLRNLLTDLYGSEDPLSKQNWEKVYQLAEEKASERNWPTEILRDYAHCNHFGTSHHVPKDERESPLESSYYSYTGEGILPYMNLLETVTGVLGELPSSTKKLKEGIEGYLGKSLSNPKVKCITISLPERMDIVEPSEGEVNRILASGKRKSQEERRLLSSYIFHFALKVYQKKKLNVVLAMGARWNFYRKPITTFTSRTIQQLADLVFQYPRVNFFVLLSSQSLAHDLTILSAMVPNVIVAGYWWHTMYPVYIKRMLEERLEVIPMNKIIGFISDAWNLEWLYGRLKMVKRETTRVLADKVLEGFYSEDTAIEIARKIFFENPKSLYLET